MKLAFYTFPVDFTRRRQAMKYYQQNTTVNAVISKTSEKNNSSKVTQLCLVSFVFIAIGKNSL